MFTGSFCWFFIGVFGWRGDGGRYGGGARKGEE